MSVNFDGSTDYYSNASWSAFTGQPMTVSAWCNTNDATIAGWISTVGVTTSDYFALFMSSSGQANFRSRSTAAGAGTAIHTGASASNNEWNHFAGKTNGTNTRFAYFNGSGTENTTDVTPATPDTVELGSLIGGTVKWNGELAHVAWWNRALDDAEITGLAQGWHPRFYSRGLVFLWDGFRLGEDDVYGLTLTENGSPVKSDEHPSVFFPSTAMNKASIFVEPAAPAAQQEVVGVATIPAPSVTIRVNAY